MGTSVMALQMQAKSAINHSGRFSERIATRSCATMPMSARPSAVQRTRSKIVRCDIGSHKSRTFVLSASARSNRSTASKNSALIVPCGGRGPPEA